MQLYSEALNIYSITKSVYQKGVCLLSIYCYKHEDIAF